MLNVFVISPEKIIYQGQAESVKLPGEWGAMEVLPFHKNLLSRLLPGSVFIDDQYFIIRRGVVKIINNKVTIICELTKEA